MFRDFSFKKSLLEGGMVEFVGNSGIMLDNFMYDCYYYYFTINQGGLLSFMCPFFFLLICGDLES